MIINTILDKYKNGNLLTQIIVGMVLGICVGAFWQEGAAFANVLGNLFTGALKAIAPILICILTLSAICMGEFEQKAGRIKNVILLYVVGTFVAALSAVTSNFLFPSKLILSDVVGATAKTQGDISSVLMGILYRLVDNPVHAIADANYLGILVWSVAAGIALRHASKASKEVFKDVNDAMMKIVTFVVKLAPFGIFGLVANSVATTGAAGLISYGKVLLVLVCTIFFVGLVTNAIIVYLVTKKNPYPLIFTCLRQSGLVAFFTRSSAANIPVNMNLCRRLKIDKELYSVTIPLGATVNMVGAAVTITTLSIAAAHTVGIHITFLQAFLLSIVASFAACGVSGVPGGSIILVPLGCSLFNISYEVAMQVVTVGFIISVVQDSVETAINSSTDVLFTAAASKNELDLSLSEK